MPRRDLYPDGAGRLATDTSDPATRKERRPPMSIVAHTRPFVIGVDAHARTHALTILACPNGEILAEAQFPATPAGMQRAITWVARCTGADLDTPVGH